MSSGDKRGQEGAASRGVDGARWAVTLAMVFRGAIDVGEEIARNRLLGDPPPDRLWTIRFAWQ